MLLTPAAAYAFHFLKFPFRRLLLIVIINAFVLPQQVVIIPLFHALARYRSDRQLPSVLIPYVGLSFAWSIFLVKNFLRGFSDLSSWRPHASTAAGRMQTFWYIVLPNSLSSIFAVGILQFLWTWNALLLPLLYLRTNVPLPVLLARINGTYELNWDLQIGGGDHHHHRPARRLPHLPTSVRRRRRNPHRQQGIRPCPSRPTSRCAIARSISISTPPSTFPAIGAAFDPDAFVATLKAAQCRLHHHLRQVPPWLVLLPHQGRQRRIRSSPARSAGRHGQGADRRRYRVPDLHFRAVGRAATRANIPNGVMSALNRCHRDRRRPFSRQAAEPRLAYTLPQSQGLSRTSMLEQAREVAAATIRDARHLLRHHPDTRIASALIASQRMQMRGPRPGRSGRPPQERRVGQRALPPARRARHCSQSFRACASSTIAATSISRAPKRFSSYSHLELESLPTGGWGYDHFRRARAMPPHSALGLSWPIPASSTQPGANSAASSIRMRLEFEAAQMMAPRLEMPRRRPAPSERSYQPRHLCVHRSGTIASRSSNPSWKAQSSISIEIVHPLEAEHVEPQGGTQPSCVIV